MSAALKMNSEKTSFNTLGHLNFFCKSTVIENVLWSKWTSSEYVVLSAKGDFDE